MRAPRVIEALDRTLGGRSRRRVIVLMACVLGLQAADLATIGALGGELESTFGISHAQLGLLASASSLVGAAATIPFGALADRVRRVPALAWAVGFWGAVMVLSALATSFAMLLGTRILLGVATAAAYPFVASLVGDYFPAAERARIWGYILTGELVGTGFGFVVSGDIAGLLSWQWAFVALALPAIGLAVALRRLLEEPQRGGQSRLQAEGAAQTNGRGDPGEGPAPRRDVAKRLALRRGVRPKRALVLDRDPSKLSLWEATRYVLRIPTNVRLIVSSSLGYFFLAGAQTFGVIFMRRSFELTQTAATSLLASLGIGAIAGVLIGGRIADRRLRSGHLRARVSVAAIAYVAAALLFLPAFALKLPLVMTMPLLIAAAAGLGAASPPLDAARLDIVPSRVWGRAEAVRTVVRTVAVAFAPVLFGWIAGLWAPPDGLRWAFLIMLGAIGASAAVLRRAAGSYPRDLASAAASEAAVTKRTVPVSSRAPQATPPEKVHG